MAKRNPKTQLGAGRAEDLLTVLYLTSCSHPPAPDTCPQYIQGVTLPLSFPPASPGMNGHMRGGHTERIPHKELARIQYTRGDDRHHQVMATTWVPPHSHLFLSVTRTHEMYVLSKVQVHHAVLVTQVTVLDIASPKPTHLKTESSWSVTSFHSPQCRWGKKGGLWKVISRGDPVINSYVGRSWGGYAAGT